MVTEKEILMALATDKALYDTDGNAYKVMSAILKEDGCPFSFSVRLKEESPLPEKNRRIHVEKLVDKDRLELAVCLYTSMADALTARRADTMERLEQAHDELNMLNELIIGG